MIFLEKHELYDYVRHGGYYCWELGDYYSESLEDAKYACSQIEACGGVDLLDVGYGHCLKGHIEELASGTSVYKKTGTCLQLTKKRYILKSILMPINITKSNLNKFIFIRKTKQENLDVTIQKHVVSMQVILAVKSIDQVHL